MSAVTGSATYIDSSQQNLYNSVDISNVRPNDKSMTDLTRQEVDAKLAASEAKVDARLANFDSSVKTGFADLRAEFAELRADMAHGRTEAAKQSNDNMKWMITAVAGMISLAVAIIGVMINWSKAPQAPPAQPAPIVVYAQPTPAAPGPTPQAPPK